MEQTTQEQEQATDAGVFVQPTLQRLTQLAGLPGGWDSYGAAPPSPQAIFVARELLVAVASRFGRTVGDRVRPYALAPIADGGVQIEWRGPRAEIEVEIDPIGQLGYLLIDKQGTDRAFAEHDNPTRPELIDAVASVLLPTA